MLISADYARLNAQMHALKPQYGTSGARWADDVMTLARSVDAMSVLDYGCGRGTLKGAINGGIEVYEYDPAIEEKQTKPLRADVVACTDVLEHIEPECLYAVLDDISELARKAVFLVVSTRTAAKHLPDGRNAHLIVEPASWWLRKILDRWNVTVFRDLGPAFVCVGKTL